MPFASFNARARACTAMDETQNAAIKLSDKTRPLSAVNIFVTLSSMSANESPGAKGLKKSKICCASTGKKLISDKINSKNGNTDKRRK